MADKTLTGPFGIQEAFVSVTDPKPMHRIHTKKQGESTVSDQLIDVAFTISGSEEAIRLTKAHAAIFEPEDPPQSVPDGGTLVETSKLKMYKCRRVGKVQLGGDNGYETDRYGIILTDQQTRKEVLRLEPEQGFEWKDIEGQDGVPPSFTGRCIAKDVKWSETMLEIMLHKLEISFYNVNRPEQANIEEKTKETPIGEAAKAGGKAEAPKAGNKAGASLATPVPTAQGTGKA